MFKTIARENVIDGVVRHAVKARDVCDQGVHAGREVLFKIRPAIDGNSPGGFYGIDEISITRSQFQNDTVRRNLFLENAIDQYLPQHAPSWIVRKACLMI